MYSAQRSTSFQIKITWGHWSLGFLVLEKEKEWVGNYVVPLANKHKNNSDGRRLVTVLKDRVKRIGKRKRSLAYFVERSHKCCRF